MLPNQRFKPTAPPPAGPRLNLALYVRNGIGVRRVPGALNGQLNAAAVHSSFAASANRVHQFVRCRGLAAQGCIRVCAGRGLRQGRSSFKRIVSAFVRESRQVGKQVSLPQFRGSQHRAFVQGSNRWLRSPGGPPRACHTTTRSSGRPGLALLGRVPSFAALTRRR